MLRSLFLVLILNSLISCDKLFPQLSSTGVPDPWVGAGVYLFDGHQIFSDNKLFAREFNQAGDFANLNVKRSFELKYLTRKVDERVRVGGSLGITGLYPILLFRSDIKKDHIGGMSTYYIGDGPWQRGFITTVDWREDKGSEDKFKRYRIYLGMGTPYAFNLGFKYRVSKSWFIEIERPILPVLFPLAFSFGTSTKEYVNPPRFIFLDLEAKVVIGYHLTIAYEIASLGLFSPPPGFGGGLLGEIDLETALGLMIYLRVGIVDYLFGRDYIYPYFQLGFGLNF